MTDFRVGIDLGGTKTEVILLNGKSQELFRTRIPTVRDDYPATLRDIASLIAQAQARGLPVTAVSRMAGRPAIRMAAAALLPRREGSDPRLVLVRQFGTERAATPEHLPHEGGGAHRTVLDQYSAALLDQFITITGACAVVSYALYTVDADKVQACLSQLLK